ncbi:MAG: hypothetical protein ACM3TU_02415 [Bacillota bacterium]
MNKYVAIFCIPAAAMQDWMTNVDETTRKEQSQQVMEQWNAWRETNKDAIVEEGMPLGKTKRVSKDAIEDVKNDMNWFMIVQAESHEAAATLVQSNPHLQLIPSAYVEVMDTGGM